MFGLIWRWSTAKASRTWIAHGLVALAPSVVVGGVVQYLGYDGELFQAITASAMGLFFLVRELGDEQKHRAEGEWNKPQWRDRVTYAVDMVGDLLGPFFVAITLWSVVLVRSMG